MINIADLPVVRAQLERDAAEPKEAQAQPNESGVGSEQAPSRSRPDLVLDQGKYYVIHHPK